MSKRSKASRFPAARIKKIMQMDEDVGKLASATPVMISKSLECFMQLILDETAKEARSRGSKKLTAYHLKHTINNTPSFDFLLDIASRIPDPTHGEAGPSEGGAGPSSSSGPSRRKPSSAGVPAAPGTAAPKRKRKSTATAPVSGGSEAGPMGIPDETERKPSMAVEEDAESEYSGRHMVRPGIGNLLNPTEDSKPFSGALEVAQGGGAGGQVGSGEGGRGMFDDYEDDDDY